MMDWNGYGWGWGWMVFMPLIWIALIGLIIWALVRIAQPAGGGERPSSDTTEPHRETPQEILDRRLASGEIDIDTYTRTMTELTARRSDVP